MDTYIGHDFQVLRHIEEPMHFHPEMEVIFIIDGEADVVIGEKQYHLEKEDIILLNSGIRHSVVNSRRGILCRIHYSFQAMADIVRNENCIFLCNSAEDKQHSYDELRKILRNLLYQYVRKKHKTECIKISLLYELLDCLIENYQIQDNMNEMHQNRDDIRMHRIIQYVNQNFQYSISLSELAQEMFVSTSTLSRFFKKQAGIYFADYLNQVRLRYAMQALLYSEKNITKIAVDCGFSNSSVFNRNFRDVYGMTPSDYRKTKRSLLEEREKLDSDIYEEIKHQLEDTAELEQETSENRLSVVIDSKKSQTYQKNWNQVINVGSAYNLTLANLQYHLVYLKEQLGYQYARIWNIFSERLMVSDGKTLGNYNYDKIDSIFDYLVSNQIIPFIDLGARSNTAVSSEGRAVFYEEECIEFKSDDVWESLLDDFIVHLAKRYGKSEVSKWIFEFSGDKAYDKMSHYIENEPDFFDSFHYVYRTIKRILPDCRVGGPMSLIDYSTQEVRTFLKKCKENKCDLDFVSFLLFPYENSVENGKFTYRRASREDNEIEQVNAMRQLMEECGFGDCKLFISEWNNSLSNRNYLNDSCFRAAYIARKLTKIWDSVDLIGLWMASDWVSSYYDTTGIANGGAGLLTKDSIRKPAYYAFHLMNQLGDELVERGENFIVTKKGDSFYIFCFNYKWFGCNYFLRHENVDSPDEIVDVFEDEAPLKLDIILDHMPDKARFTIKKRNISDSEGTLLSEWKKFQYDNDLQNGDVKYIRDMCFPRMSMEKCDVKDGKLVIEQTLKAHEISLIHVYEDIV